MKVEHHSDATLRTRIRRSYWNIDETKMKEGAVTTRLFTFERLECKEIEGIHWDVLRCIKVTVLLTNEVYVATQAIVFGTDTWTLYKIEDGPELIEE